MINTIKKNTFCLLLSFIYLGIQPIIGSSSAPETFRAQLQRHWTELRSDKGAYYKKYKTNIHRAAAISAVLGLGAGLGILYYHRAKFFSPQITASFKEKLPREEI